MEKLSRQDLSPLETYHEQRSDFRARVMAHKADRRLKIGAHATLYFEDRLTIQYQVQEMLRVERIFESGAIEEELGAYNPLIPDGDNWKATFMLEYEDEHERQLALQKLVGIEDKVWVRIGDGDPVFAIADEDLERSRESKTSAVHFLRFQLTEAQVAAVKSDASLSFGIDHSEYTHSVAPLPSAIAASLRKDLG